MTAQGAEEPARDNEAETRTPLRRWLPVEAGGDDSTAVGRYLSMCRNHQAAPCADVLISLDVGCERLTVRPQLRRGFGDLELRTVLALLEEEEGSRLETLRVVKLSECVLGPSGMRLLSRLLAHPRCRIEELDISYQNVGPEGAEALAGGLAASQTLRRLEARSCGFERRGAEALAAGLEAKGSAAALEELDVQNNFMGYRGARRLKEVGASRGLTVRLEGNLVVDEIYNALTHGFGAAAAIVGTVFLGLAAWDKPQRYVVCVVLYCASLITLFLSSTLYHSFHALGPTVTRIFCVLDHSGICFLIAGTYTPFFGILFYDRWWSSLFLVGIWSAALMGCAVTIWYQGEWKVTVENTIYLCMGWACCAVLPDLFAALSFWGAALLVAGGVLYSLGVPWFVKDGHTCGVADHNIWHVFVLLGAASHYWCIYQYVVSPDPPAAAAHSRLL